MNQRPTGWPVQRYPTHLSSMYSFTSRQWALTVGLLLLPALAQADPLNNGALGAIGLVVLLFIGLFGVTLGLTFWAYLRPSARAVFWVQLLLLGICLWLGMLQERYFPGELPLLGNYNPLLQVCVPLGVWLNGVTLARRTQRIGTGLFWVGAAVMALLYLLTVLPYALLSSYSGRIIGPSGGAGLLQVSYLLLALVGGVSSWWVVLHQIVRAPARQARFWWPWWRAPAVGAMVGMVYFSVQMAFVLVPHAGIMLDMPWAQLLQAAFKGAVVNWVAGVIAVRLTWPMVAMGQ